MPCRPTDPTGGGKPPTLTSPSPVASWVLPEVLRSRAQSEGDTGICDLGPHPPRCVEHPEAWLSLRGAASGLAGHAEALGMGSEG